MEKLFKLPINKIMNDENSDYVRSLDLVQSNDGKPLTSIDVAVAKPDEGFDGAPEIVKDLNGNDAYAVLPVNGSATIDMKIELDTTQLGGNTYMGQELGVLEGFRYYRTHRK